MGSRRAPVIGPPCRDNRAPHRDNQATPLAPDRLPRTLRGQGPPPHPVWTPGSACFPVPATRPHHGDSLLRGLVPDQEPPSNPSSRNRVTPTRTHHWGALFSHPGAGPLPRLGGVAPPCG
ncbi:hypothetical protein V6N12_000571 [Hibiscus sabdariffa]|uniref:Uncharacterized protein n=1 Tax=Hibiscus sabdariffa TaxID=183260 RepID=A0ABR2ALF4_9ROSI